MKKLFKFKWLLLSFILSIASINTAWAKSVHLYNGYIKASFNGNNCWSSNWYGMYSGGPNASLGTAEYMGVLTGDFIITDCKMKINSDYEVLTSQHKFWCNVDGSGGYQEYIIYWNKSNGDGYPEANSINKTVARSTDPSGDHSINVGFNSRFEESYGKWELDQNLQTYYFSYKVLPPNVSDFTVASSGNILSGTGTEDDPFIISKNGSLTLTSSGGTQAHTDGNSSIQFSKDNSNWGTTSDYTVKIISNITTTDRTAVNVYARYYNSASCIGAVKTKTYYYKTAPWSITGTMNNWNTDDQPIAHYSSGTGYVDITLEANTDYEFKVKNRTNADWHGGSVELSYTSGNGNPQTLSTSGGNCSMTTAGKGTYRFTWNGTNTLTVTYPTSYTVTFGYGEHGTSVTATGSVSGELAVSGKYVAKGENVTFTETHDTGYKLKGWYTASSGGSAVGTMSYNVLNSIAANANVYSQYEGNDFTVVFNANYPSGTTNNSASMSNQAFEYETAENLTANAFACEGYTFTGWKKDNATSGDDVTAGSDGSTLTTTDGETVNLYAQWSDDGKYYYKGASANAWSTAANWTKGVVPSSGSDVIALKPLQAPSGTTTVNSVRIATSGTYTPVGGSGIAANGSLTIPGLAALKVATSVANCTISENAPTSGTSTTSSTLHIGVGGALAWRTAGSPGAATVGFYTPSGGVPGSQDAINDYIGIPFTSLSSDAYYNAWVFAVSGGAWTEISGATLSPWTGYNIIEKKEKGESMGGSYSLSGTLVANNAAVSGGASAGTETLYANSWVAPIEISEMDFSGTATVYLFNPASFNQIVSAGNPLGNYTSYPKNSSGGAYIPSMKSFSVVSSTVSINYASAVYGQVGGAYSAPRRERKADYRQAIWDTQDTLFVYVKCASGWADELKMYIHNDFSQDYENGWDGPKMEGMWEAPKLYMLNNEGEMAVSCVPSVDNTIIAFHAGTAANEYTFQFKYSGSDELYLRDTKTGEETLISAENTYTFTSESNDSDLRFIIVNRTPATTTDIETVSGEQSTANGVQKILHNGALYIIREGHIFDAQGNLVK